MKRLVLALLLIFALPLQAQTVKQRFDKAVRLTRQGNYADSAKILSPLVEKYNRRDGAILYNLAVDEFGTQRYGQAIYHLLMAEKSTNPKVRSMAKVGANRLRKFLTRRQAKQKSAMRRFLFQPYHDYMTMLFGQVGFRLTLWIALVLWFWGIIFLGLFRLGKAKDYSGKLAAVFLVLAIFGAGIAAGRHYVAKNYTLGVLVKDAGIFKSADSLDPQSYLPEGLEVRVMQTEGAMTRIRVADGSGGFVQTDKVRALP